MRSIFTRYRTSRIQGSAFRAWLVGHDAAPTLLSWAAVALLVIGWGHVLLPGYGVIPRIPTWQLLPPALAGIAGLTAVNDLPTLPGPIARRARLQWGTAVALSSGAVCAFVALTSGLPLAGPALWTTLLTAVVMMFSLLLGRAAPIVMLPVVLVVFVRYLRVDDASTPWVLGSPQFIVLGAVFGLASICAYAVDIRMRRVLGRAG